jgi:hypothetical protein
VVSNSPCKNLTPIQIVMSAVTSLILRCLAVIPSSYRLVFSDNAGPLMSAKDLMPAPNG